MVPYLPSLKKVLKCGPSSCVGYIRGYVRPFAGPRLRDHVTKP